MECIHEPAQSSHAVNVWFYLYMKASAQEHARVFARETATVGEGDVVAYP